MGVLAPYIKAMAPVDDLPTAYVCQNFACKLPTTDIVQMLKHLGVAGRNQEQSPSEDKASKGK